MDPHQPVMVSTILYLESILISQIGMIVDVSVRFHPFFQLPPTKEGMGSNKFKRNDHQHQLRRNLFNLALTALSLMLLEIIDNLRGSAPIEKEGRGGQSG